MVRNSAALLLMALAVTPFILGQKARQHPNREHFQNAEVLYGWARDHHAERFRTFIIRPNDITGKVPAIFFVGWLRCDTMEYSDADTHHGFRLLPQLVI